MTSFFAWNMRGFNMSRKHGVVRSWVQSEKPLFGCLVETRVRQKNHLKCMKAALPGWNSVKNYDYHRLGRIWFCWSDKVSVTLLHRSAQIITCAIQVPETGEEFIVSAVYAYNTASERRSLWEDMREMHTDYSYLAIPWILVGDFNVTLASGEHSRMLDYLSDQAGMRHFQDVVGACDLTDLAYVGALFTWWNKREGNPVGKKLDRAMINETWMHRFPQSYAIFDTGGVSDRERCMVSLSDSREEVRRRFKIFNFLAEHEQFIPTVKAVWDSSEPLHHSRSTLSRFHHKLKELKKELRALNKNYFGNITERVKQAFEALCICQNQVLLDPTPSKFAEAEELSNIWHKLAAIEERFFRQKSCIKWLQAGDHNTTFFHRAVQSRNTKSSIKVLINRDGETLTAARDIKKEAVLHFQRFLQQQQGDGEVISVHYLQNLLTFRCTSERAATLVAPVTPQEIFSALHSLPKDKVSGPDGYTKEFFMAAWAVVGGEFVTTIQSFFLYIFLPTGINVTILSLIPKVENAQTMKEFLPIAFCNLLYKVISKVLAVRLKALMPEAIEPNQSAFIKGRLLLENVLLASELVNGYHKKSTSPRYAIKFDISKAFDTVKWSFITDVLKAMNLPDQFIHWIHICISTASFSVAVNGSLEGFFTSARGIRQGCSLSPYLYVILNNVLSKMLNEAAANGVFEYHPQCRAVNLTHLSFLDDILVFTDGSVRSLDGVLEVISRFARFSGLHINTTKSYILTSRGCGTEIGMAAAAKGIGMGVLPISYLGLPLTTKTLTRHDYEPLIDKVRKRLLSWANKSLSYAGRLQLIKSVIYNIVNFWSSAFILLMGCLDTIQSLCSAFLWSETVTQTHSAKVAWKDFCYPKEEGGLGLRRLRDTTRVFALGLIWMLFSGSSLWKFWIQVYLLRNSSFWDVKENSQGS